MIAFAAQKAAQRGVGMLFALLEILCCLVIVTVATATCIADECTLTWKIPTAASSGEIQFAAATTVRSRTTEHFELLVMEIGMGKEMLRGQRHDNDWARQADWRKAFIVLIDDSVGIGFKANVLQLFFH